MTPKEFIAKWYASLLKERSAARKLLPATRRADPPGSGPQRRAFLLRESIGLDGLV